MSIQCTPDLIMMTDELELQGVPKKGDPRLNGHKGHYKLTKDKSMVSFEKSENFLSTEHKNSLFL